MGHYINGICPTHGDIDMDDSLAFCEECREVVDKGELTRLRARVEELEARNMDLVGRMTALGQHHALRAAKQRVAELERVAEVRLMRAARAEASRAVLMQAMADRARMGYGEWARQWIFKADSAAKSVRREDLVVATVNSAALDAAEGEK